MLPGGEIGALARNLFTFVGMLAVVVPTLWLVTGRPPWTLLMPEREAGVGLFLKGAAIQTACLSVITPLAALTPLGHIEFQRPDPSLVAAALPIALVGFVIQTGAEELMFRGYLSQAVYRFTSWPWLIYGIPAYLFAQLHVGNVSALGGGWLAYMPYFSIALLWGWLAWRTGSLWLGWGMHYANNVFLVLLIGSHDDVLQPVSGLAFVYNHPGAPQIVATGLVSTFTAGLLAWALIVRRLPNAGRLALNERLHQQRGA